MDVLISLSRLINAGIGEGKTRADHRYIADQLYALYAEGRDLRRLAAIIGKAALSENERLILNFADRFETKFIGQGSTDREIEATLNLAWELMSEIPVEQLKRIPQHFLEKYYQGK